MTDNPIRYFEMLDHHLDMDGQPRLDDPMAVDYGGNHEPIVDLGLGIPTSVLVKRGNKSEVSAASHALRVKPATNLDDVPARIIPDTRIVETDHALVANVLLECGLFREIDKPNKTVLDHHHKRTAAHHEAMKNRDQQVATGNEPAPDATDNPAAVGQEG